MDNNTDKPVWRLWLSWAGALLRLDEKKAKEIADQITRKQDGKPPRNTGNWGG